MTTESAVTRLDVPESALTAACREFGETAVTMHDDPNDAIRAIAAPVVAAELKRLVAETMHDPTAVDVRSRLLTRAYKIERTAR